MTNNSYPFSRSSLLFIILTPEKGLLYSRKLSHAKNSEQNSWWLCRTCNPFRWVYIRHVTMKYRGLVTSPCTKFAEDTGKSPTCTHITSIVPEASWLLSSLFFFEERPNKRNVILGSVEHEKLELLPWSRSSTWCWNIKLQMGLSSSFDWRR